MIILYEDKNMAVCQKGVGYNSEYCENGKSLAKLFEQKYGYAGVIHRLDVNVGGAIVYAKNKKAAADLSRIVAEGNLTKEYLAIVEGTPEEKGVFKDLLFKDSAKNKVFVVKKMRKGVKEASLEYTLLQTVYVDSKPLSLVKIKLHTGRSHQIRVQFSSRQMPLAGDGKYGSKNNKCSVALWSHSLTFPQKENGSDLLIKCIPDIASYPWNMFDFNCLL